MSKKLSTVRGICDMKFQLILLVISGCIIIQINGARSKRTLSRRFAVAGKNSTVLDEEEEEEEEEEEDEKTGAEGQHAAGSNLISPLGSNAKNDYEQNVESELAGGGFVSQTKRVVTDRPSEDTPRGPIVLEEQLEDRYATKFTPGAKKSDDVDSLLRHRKFTFAG